MQDRNLLKQILEATRHIWDQAGTRWSVRKAFRAVLECGTAALGWEVYASDTEEKRCYHTCKSRFCPSCGYRATLLWLEEQEAALPDIPYTGVVFTMPRELWPVFKRNRHLLHDLPALAAGVIQQWISRKYGARALIMVVPHTFGGDLKFNSHIHLLVSAGGFEESDGHWIPRLSLNKDALMKMWRFAVISHLRLALKSGVLESNLNIRDMRSLLSNAYKSERHPRWIIFLETIVSKAHFLRYAARYVRRPPIAKWRLLKVTDTDVEFVAKDTKAGLLVPTRRTLPEFIRLLAAHVPAHYRHGIRYFGLLAPRTKRFTYAALSVFLGQTRRPRPRRLSWRSSILKYFGFDPLIDSRGQEMHWVRRESVIAR
jgi:hypothetical protein